MTNETPETKKRNRTIDILIDVYASRHPEVKRETLISFLLTDLRHWCKKNELNFELVEIEAKELFDDEEKTDVSKFVYSESE